MLSNQEIQVLNFTSESIPKYQIHNIGELTQDNLLEQIIPKEIHSEKNDRFISNIKLIENYIIIISTKTTKNISESNCIKIFGFEITIIKLNLNEGEKKNNEINITIPLKEAQVITNKNFLVQKYFFCDFIKISEEKNYFHICVFDQLHIYKIYIKDDQLKYNKIELKKFNDKTKVLYLGEHFIKEENKLEISLLLKPLNNLIFLEINTDEKSQKIEEKIYEFKNMKYNKNIFHKYLRSFCGKFLFTEKESNKKYLIYRDKSGDIIAKETLLDLLDDKSNNNNNFINFLYTIDNKIYLLAELPKDNDEEYDNEYIILGIFNLLYNEENDAYKSYLMQKIRIPNEVGNKDYFININMDNDITIQTSENLFYIELGEFGSVEKIFKLTTNSKEFQISKIISVQYSQWLILLSFIKDKIFISKLIREDSNCVEKNCGIYYDFDELNNERNENEDNNQIFDNDNNNDIIDNNKDMKDTINDEEEKTKINIENEDQYSSEAQCIISHLSDYIDKIINDKMETNNQKINSIKQEYEKKIELIKEDLEQQKKENEKLEKCLDEMLNKFGDFIDSDKENKNTMNNESTINSLNNINEMFKAKNNAFQKNDKSNYMPFMRQFNAMRMMNPFNFFPTENMFNAQVMNDPRFAHLFNNGMINQGNYFQGKNK